MERPLFFKNNKMPTATKTIRLDKIILDNIDKAFPEYVKKKEKEGVKRYVNILDYLFYKNNGFK